MAEQRLTKEQDAVLQQQYLRALSSFEGIILSQIDIKNKFGDRLNYSIQAGIIILGVVALSILVLLLTLSAQITRISAVVHDMNVHFSSVAEQMHQVRGHMVNIEARTALLEGMDRTTKIMDEEMDAINLDVARIREKLSGVDRHVAKVRDDVGNISVNTDVMNHEVQGISQEMHKLARPARTMNNIFPFP